jgi:hypothetical protein
MNFCLHLLATICPIFYQRRIVRSIREILPPELPAALGLTLALVGAPTFGAQTLAQAAATPRDGGFAPAQTILFAPLLQLVPPGPGRAARAINLFDQQASFYRRILFHPILTPELSKVTESMPPRGATLLLAASLYSRNDIPWRHEPDGAHRLAVTGAAAGTNYLFALAPPEPLPIEANQFRSNFTLRPIVDAAGETPSSVIGELAAKLRLDGYDPHSSVDLPAAMLRECYGDLKGPWDTIPGRFNSHDRAALDRLRRDMPTLYSRLQPYFQVRNVLDEFAPVSGAPRVLMNLDAQIRPAAFNRFPHFAAFYSRIAPRVDVTIIADNPEGGQWGRIRFDRGRIQMVFLDSSGMLRPFDSSFAPRGPALAPEAAIHGSYRVTMRLHYTRLKLTFGLEDLTFITDYTRDRDGLRFVTRMPSPPALVAPPIVQQVVRILAERFMTAMAVGHGGTIITLDSHATGADRTELAAQWRAELSYSPALRVLAEVADAIANAHNEAVREDERHIGEELFEALLRDYNVAKPRLLALDGPTPSVAH